MRVEAESFWYLNLGNVKERLRKSYFQRCGQPKGETQRAGDQKQQQRPRASSISLGSEGRRGGAVTRAGRETCGGQDHPAGAVTFHPQHPPHDCRGSRGWCGTCRKDWNDVSADPSLGRSLRRGRGGSERLST